MTYLRFHKRIYIVKIQVIGDKNTRYRHLIDEKKYNVQHVKHVKIQFTARTPFIAFLLSNSIA